MIKRGFLLFSFLAHASQKDFIVSDSHFIVGHGQYFNYNIIIFSCRLLQAFYSLLVELFSKILGLFLISLIAVFIAVAGHKQQSS